MKRKVILAIIATVFVGGVAFLAISPDQPITPEASAEDSDSFTSIYGTFPESSDNGTNEDEEYVILDVRTQEEYDIVHVQESTLIPDTELATRAEAEIPNKNAVIMVYCQSGTRSARATTLLTAMGYTNVIDVGAITTIPDDVKVWTE